LAPDANMSEILTKRAFLAISYGFINCKEKWTSSIRLSDEMAILYSFKYAQSSPR
jgi:hypothetical protein